MPVRGQVLCVAPFNEEMNRCRSMATLLACTLASQGWGTLLVDLHGTGDSAGDYEEARWDHWLADLQAAAQWLDGQPGGCRVLWGIRLGAILAAQLHARRADAGCALVLWQPVLDGKLHLTQFLRVKIAAAMDLVNQPKLTTAGMRADFAAGRTVEVAGYALHPALADALDAARLADHALPTGARVLWLEQGHGDNPELPPVSRSLLERWPGEGRLITTLLFAGPAFWQVHERAVAPGIIEYTSAWLAGPGTAT